MLGNGDAIDAAVINDAVNIMVSFSVLSLQIGHFDHLIKIIVILLSLSVFSFLPFYDRNHLISLFLNVS